MTESMVKRGPDAKGTWLSKHVALGHRRLAVIDIAGGNQPMSLRRDNTRHCSDIVLIFSGEIYNFRDLRRELQSHGHAFATASDTEVLLYSYVQWGRDCAYRLNGMFAFAVWDGECDELFLARDRLGIKPLYYYPYDGGIIFGSEPKAIIANPIFRPELDAQGIAELFVMPAAPTPGHGIFRGLYELKPGHTLSARREALKMRRYWNLSSEPHSDDPATTVRHVRELLEDIVTRQLVSDVPICALVSGGIDSSAIAALAATVTISETGSSHRRLRTFSMDFAGEDEVFEPDAWRPSRDGPYAEIVAGHLQTDHTPVVLDFEAVWAARGRALRARDLPSWGDLDTCLYLLFEAVRTSSVVALSGESADELFGGYPWHGDESALRSGTFPWLSGSVSPSVLLRPEVQRDILPEGYRAERYAEAIMEVQRARSEDQREFLSRQALYLGLTRWLPALLNRKDRLSMALGLEVRVPYCDHRLVEYVSNVPWSTKTLHGTKKGLLREAVADLLPREVLTRAKSAPPVCHNPAYVSRLISRLRAVLDTPPEPFREIIDVPKVRSLLDRGERLPGPTPGPGTSIGFAYLLDVSEWLTAYEVKIV